MYRTLHILNLVIKWGVPNLWENIEKAGRKLQEQMEELKKNLCEARFTGKSFDGKIIATANGLEEIVEINFNCNIKSENIIELEKSILDAVNNALDKVRNSLEEQARKFTEGFNFNDID